MTRSFTAEDLEDGGKVLIVQEGDPQTGTLTVLRLSRDELAELRGVLPRRVRPLIAPPLPPSPDDPGSPRGPGLPGDPVADDGRQTPWDRARPWFSGLALAGWLRR